LSVAIATHGSIQLSGTKYDIIEMNLFFLISVLLLNIAVIASEHPISDHMLWHNMQVQVICIILFHAGFYWTEKSMKWSISV